MKLKKILVASILSMIFLISSMASAAPSLSNFHRAKGQLPAKTATNEKRSLKSVGGYGYYDTRIDVLNASSQIIYVTIPGSSVYKDPIWPGEPAIPYICEDYFDMIQVKIYDSFGICFFNKYVDNGSLIKVVDTWLFSSASDKAGQDQGKSKLNATVSK